MSVNRMTAKNRCCGESDQWAEILRGDPYRLTGDFFHYTHGASFCEGDSTGTIRPRTFHPPYDMSLYVISQRFYVFVCFIPEEQRKNSRLG